jgi:hypothetical protein
MRNHSYSLLRCLRRSPLSRAGLIGLCAFSVGCEPELDTDAATSEAAVGQHEAAVDQAEAAVTDADVLDAAERDAAPSSDGSASTGSDASISPGGDGSVSDASTSAMGDASTPASDGSTPDASILDTGALDGNTSGSDAAVDAQGPADASAADTGSLRDAATADAALALRTRSGEVRWGVQSGQGSAFCPFQSIALWKDETLTLEDRTSRGFACTEWFDTCARPAPGEPGNITYIFHNADMEVHLTFRDAVLQGYSIEAFRANLLQTNLRWTSETKTNIGNRRADFIADFQPALELVSYEAPFLHVRLEGMANWGPSFGQQATVPYVCFHGSPVPTPDICTEVGCGYRVVDPEDGVHVRVDLKARIQQPDP